MKRIVGLVKSVPALMREETTNPRFVVKVMPVNPARKATIPPISV